MFSSHSTLDDKRQATAQTTLDVHVLHKEMLIISVSNVCPT